jgi:hypothetical protein
MSTLHALDISEAAGAALCISFVTAQVRRNIERLILVTFNALIAVIEAVTVSLERVLDRLGRILEGLAAELVAPYNDLSSLPEPQDPEGAVGSPSAQDHPEKAPLTLRRAVVDASGPLFYCVAAVSLLTGDLYLAALRTGPLFGFEVSTTLINPRSVEIQLLTGVLYVVTTVVYAAVLFEVMGIGRRQPPFGTLPTGASRTMVVSLSGLGMALSALVASILFVWGQSAAAGSPDNELAKLFFALFAPLMVVATGLAFVGARQSVTAIRYIAVILFRWLGASLYFSAEFSVKVVSAPRDAGVAAIGLVATPGQTLWNWICRFAWAQRIHLLPLPATGLLESPVNSAVSERKAAEIAEAA